MKKIFTLLFLLVIAECVWAQKDTIPRFGSNQGQTYTSAGVTYVYYNYSTQPLPVTITPNASQTNVRVNNVTGNLQIDLTNTSSRLGDQIILCFNSDSTVHSITGSGIDFSRYFPNGTFQCNYFCGIFFFVVDDTGQRIFVNNDSPRLSGSESSAACNYSAGFGAMNANNGSTGNTNVGINAGHNTISSGNQSTNIGCNAGAGTLGGDNNIYIGNFVGFGLNLSNTIGIGANPIANGQTVIGAVDGNVFFSGVSGAGSFPTVTLQGANRTGSSVGGNNFQLSGGGGTGTAAPGAIVFLTYDTNGTSASTPQVRTEKMRILGESGRVGIGTAAPISKLHVVGQPTFVTGNEGDGKVLTSDANGTGDWVTPVTLDFGVYFPTITPFSNIDVATEDTLQYMRVGNVVTVSGEIQIDATTAGVVVSFDLSIPILSTFTDATDAGGTCASANVAQAGGISADGVGNVIFGYLATSTNNEAIDFSFTYRIK